jgi:small conductance mechanosensitive channel
VPAATLAQAGHLPVSRIFIFMDTIMQKFIDRAYNWIVVYGPRIILAIAIFFVGQWLIKNLNRWLKKILAGKRFDPTLRPFLQNLFQIILQILLILALMQVLGIQMTLFAALIGAMGVAIGLALSGTLQNFANGVLIILLKPFRIGDNIRTQNEEGTVTSIRLFYTLVRTFNNTTLIIPNNKFSNDVIFNLTREKKRRIDFTIKLSHEVDFNQVRQTILQTIASFKDCLEDPPPRVGIDKVEADGYTVVINAWTDSHGFQDTRLLFNEKVMESLRPLILKKPDKA